jgi:PAX-interacting protein 1
MFIVIAKHLMETDSRFHNFMSSTYRSYKVIIRNLHHTTLISDISDAFSKLGHSTRRITNVIKNGNPCSLFLVELKPNTNNKVILNLFTISHTKIKFELPYRTNSGPPQCINCQNYGHIANYCHHLPHCVKCGGDHSTDTCTKDKDNPAKCALCMGADSGVTGKKPRGGQYNIFIITKTLTPLPLTS